MNGLDRAQATLAIQERINRSLGDGVVNRDCLAADPHKEMAIALLVKMLGVENEPTCRQLVEALSGIGADEKEADSYLSNLLEDIVKKTF